MDYEALAKQYGGAVAAPPPMDYDALARQYGGAIVANSGIPSARKGVEQIPGYEGVVPAAQTVAPQKGVGGMLGQTLGGLIETPIAIGANLISGIPSYLSGALGSETQQKIAQNINYQPRTEMARNALEAIARNPVVEKLPPFMNRLGVGQTAATAGRALSDAARSEAGLIKESVQAPLAARTARIAQERSLESYQNAPRIDAAKDALDLGIALNPAVTNPTIGNKLRAAVVGGESLDTKLAQHNLPKYTEAAKTDLGIPITTKLDAKSFEQSRARPEVSAPYEAVRKLRNLQPDADVMGQLENMKVTPLIGDTGQAAAANSLLDAVKEQITQGIDGKTLVDSIRARRRDAQNVYNAQSKGIAPPSPEQVARADINMGVANILEGMIESNIGTNPKLLTEFRAARTNMAKTYDYERATNFATGQLDPQVIAKMAAEGKLMTGTLAKIGNVAANFPEVSKGGVANAPVWRETLPRSGIAATIGAASAQAMGIPFYYGGVAGAAAGNVVGGAMARGMAKPEFQAAKAMPPDYRLPINQLAADVQPGTSNLAIFDPRNALVQPGQQPYAPNFTTQGQGRGPTQAVWDPVSQTFRGELAPEVTTVAPEAPRNALGYSPEVPVQGQPGAFDIMRARERELSMRRGQQAEVAQVAAEAAVPRKPATRETILDFDPITGRFKMGGEGIKGATPEIFMSDTGRDLNIASQKVALNRKFDLSATEKIAWEKTKVDLAEVAPEFKKLSDKTISEKMMDRKWTEDAITKAREKAAMFDDLSKRMANEQSKRDASIKRDQMLDLLATLEDQLRAPRATSAGGQGPKTREAIRNQLLGGENQNKLRGQ